VPLATMIAAEDGLNLAIYHPSKHNPEGKIGSISGNFSKVSQKCCLIVDDCITTGNTLTEIVNYLRRHKSTPVGICVIFDKRGVREIEGVPVYSLFTIKRID
jgi:orotate phosphoribosyltransferase